MIYTNHDRRSIRHALAGLLARNDAERLAVWTVLAACVLLRLRRTAALVATGMLIWAASPATYTPAGCTCP
jgi:hypothetical protein